MIHRRISLRPRRIPALRRTPRRRTPYPRRPGAGGPLRVKTSGTQHHLYRAQRPGSRADLADRVGRRCLGDHPGCWRGRLEDRAERGAGNQGTQPGCQGRGHLGCAGQRRAWRGVASSADGKRLVAWSRRVIYTSDDSGLTWISSDSGIGNWFGWPRRSAARSWWRRREGAGRIYRSTNWGKTWALDESSPARSWQFVASSADGTASWWQGRVTFNGDQPIYVSIDGIDGGAWKAAPQSPVGQWFSGALSADGTGLTAVGAEGLVSPRP